MKKFGCFSIIALISLFWLDTVSAMTADEQHSLDLSINFLRDRMDEFHTRFPIYDDVSAAGNHFNKYAIIKNVAKQSTIENVSVTGAWKINPHSGATCLKFSFTPDKTIPNDFGGYFLMNGVLTTHNPPERGDTLEPQVNFGEIPKAGLDIIGAKRLTFYAKGDKGGENIKFMFGGVGWNPDTNQRIDKTPYPDSAHPPGVLLTLTNQWKLYSIDLTGLDTSYVLGGFGWSADALRNPTTIINPSIVFYVDDINIELDFAGQQYRLAQPRFLRSFLTAPYQPNPFDPITVNDLDFVLRNTAFTYDNALALLAFLADGTEDSIRRARLIGDAFVYAAKNDRYYTDGRIRTAYSAGDISLPPGWTTNNNTGTVPVSGFYIEYNDKKEFSPSFKEVEQDAVDTGNNAWVMISLLKLYQNTRDIKYLDTARRIGNFIHNMRNDSQTSDYKGFLGGINNPENPTIPKTPAVPNRPWASVEHNLDIYAAFSVMFNLTGNTLWQDDATHAKEFVESMFDNSRGCYLAGTLTNSLSSPITRNLNPWQLPVDVQAWSILSLRSEITNRYATLLNCAETNNRTVSDGLSGFDFNNDKDGVWFEGTGQMAVAYAFTQHSVEQNALRQTLRQAQAIGIYGEPKGLPAASHDGLSTGFNTSIDSPTCIPDPKTCTFKYFRRQHVGATAWNIFAQTGFNPYYDLGYFKHHKSLWKRMLWQ